MTNKAYIVVNKQQEREVLEQLEREGMVWGIINEKPTDFNPRTSYLVSFPYVIFVNDWVSWNWLSNLKNEEIVFDGRKEEQMSEKYVVSQEFMNELEDWKEAYITDTLDEKYHYVSAGDLDTLPGMIKDWWIDLDNKSNKTNNHLIAIIRWVNGEDVFEADKPKKWVVRSKEKDGDGEYWYISVNHVSPDFYVSEDMNILEYATKFNTKEEAESWANSHQEVVEIESD